MRRPARLLLLVSAVLALGRAAAPDVPVALPPFIVEEPTKGPPWRYAAIPGGEVLSRCNDATTRRVLDAHHRLHRLLADILPESLQLVTGEPRLLILYDEELQPAASREVISRMLREADTRVPPVELDLPGGRGRSGGFQPPAAARRLSFLPNLRLWDRDAMALFMIVRQQDFDATNLSLTHDYVSFVVRNRLPALPPWFVHGFLALFREIRFEGESLEAPAFEWISRAQTEALRKDPKTAPTPLPLAAFFAGAIATPEPAGSFDPLKRWQAQAELFVRWGLDPRGGAARREAFWKFVALQAERVATEVLFRACFGTDFAAAEAEITAFLPQAVRRTTRYRPAKLGKPPAVVLRNATDTEIARIKGDWERLEVPFVHTLAPGLAEKYREQARRTLRRAYDRDARDPRLLAVMGLCEVDAGNDAGAREFLEAAAAGETSLRPRANYELARLRFAAARAQPEGPGGLLSVGQTADVLRLLFAARAVAPPLPEVYDLIGEVWAQCSAPPTRGHLAVLDEGIRLFPRRTPLLLRAAELNARHGFREQAATLAEIGLRGAADPAVRERFTVLRKETER